MTDAERLRQLAGYVWQQVLFDARDAAVLRAGADALEREATPPAPPAPVDWEAATVFGQIEQPRFKTIPRTPVDDARLRELAEGFRSESHKPEAGSADWWRDVAQGLAAEVGLLRAEVAALRQGSK